MIEFILTALVAMWDFWCVPFALLPYGDPYGAAAALFIVGAFATKRFING